MAQLPLLFKWFAVSSAQAAILVCVVLAVQGLFGKRLGARWQWALWLLVVARLVLPWAPESSMSIFNAVPALGNQTREAAPVTQRQPLPVSIERSAATATPTAAGKLTSEPSPVRRAAESGPVQAASWARATARIGVMGFLAFVWLVGAIGLAVYAVGQGVVLAMRLRGEPRVTEAGVLSILEDCKAKAGVKAALSVVETRWVKSPALFGIRRPALLLPEGTTGRLGREELGFVFMHELGHLKRHDLEINWLVSALQFAHWFNPVLWYGFYRMRADREVACDALVLSHTQPGEAARYGRTIVGLLEGVGRPRRLAGMVGILEDKSQLKRRITMIAKFQPGARKWSVLAVAVLAVLAAMTLTNAKGAGPAQPAAASSPNTETPTTARLVRPNVNPSVAASEAVAAAAPNVNLGGVDAQDAEVAEVKKRLEMRIATFDFTNQPMGATVEFLRTAGSVNIVLDGKAVPGDMVISLSINDATMATILDLICTQAKANWTVVKNYVYISDEAGIKELLSRGPNGGKSATPARQPMAVVAGQSTPGMSGRMVTPVEVPDPDVAEVKKKLEKRLANFDFQNQPIATTVEFLRTAGNVNIVLDSKAVPGESTISLRIEDATIATILDLISTQANANWTVVKNYVYISDNDGMQQLLSRGPGAVVTPPVSKGRDIGRKAASGGGSGEELTPILTGLSGAELAAQSAALKGSGIEYKIGDGMLLVKPADRDKVFLVLSDKGALPKNTSESFGPGGGVVPGELWITLDDVRLQEGQYCRFLAATIHSKRVTSLDVQLGAAAVELQRIRAMFEKGAASGPDVEKAQLNYDELKAKIAEQSPERRVRDVTFTFYLGDPEKGGKKIGTGGLDVKLGEEATEAIPWDAAPGNYDIFVSIGPGSGDYRGLSWLKTKALTMVKIDAPFKLKEQGGSAAGG